MLYARTVSRINSDGSTTVLYAGSVRVSETFEAFSEAWDACEAQPALVYSNESWLGVPATLVYQANGKQVTYNLL